MSFILGIDAGGTYTDGVVIDSQTREILSKAKTLTTKYDLTVGLADCIDQLDFDDKQDIALVSVSTTLATNTVVEGKGAKVGLIYMGEEIAENIPDVRMVKVKGRMDITGNEKEPIDRGEIEEALQSLKGEVEALAISGYAGVRNPKHEQEVKNLADKILGVPSVCGHELTSALGFEHRTVTAALNSRLIKVIERLIKSVRKILDSNHIHAPVMIVKGDGSLMSEEEALRKPVNTVLSGPAASIMGALALTGRKKGLVLDMGGTTCDFAVIEDGAVKIKKEGAKVGGWFTRVQAAEISTFGLGGDSKIYPDEKGRLKVSTERVCPLCVAGAEYPELMREMHPFRRVGEIKQYSKSEADCYIYMGKGDEKAAYGELDDRDRKVIEALKEKPHSICYLAEAAGCDPEKLNLDHLVNAGIIGRIGLTPTDILHIEGRYGRWDKNIAYKGAEIFAQRKKVTMTEFIKEARGAVRKRLALILLQSTADLAGEQTDYENSPDVMNLIELAFGERKNNLLKPALSLKKPVVAIGAPVAAWINEVKDIFGAEIIVPENADVANAYGAAVGRVTKTVEMGISIVGNQYMLNTPWERYIYNTMDEAMFYAIHEGRKHIEHSLADAGCRRWEIKEEIEKKQVKNEAMDEMIDLGTKVTITGEGTAI